MLDNYMDLTDSQRKTELRPASQFDVTRQSKRVRLTRGGADAANLFNDQDDKELVNSLLQDSSGSSGQ